MAWSIVQSVSASANAAGSISKNITSTGSGNLLIVTSTSTSTSATLTPSASAGTAQTFTSIANPKDNEQFQAWYVPNCASGTTQIKVTRSAGTGQSNITIMEVAGAATSLPLDVSTSSTSVGTTGTTGTTAIGNEFWFAMLGAASLSTSAPSSSNLSSGWTQDQNTSSSAGGSGISGTRYSISRAELPG